MTGPAQQVLLYWPIDGSIRATGHSHVVRYDHDRRSALGAAVAHSLGILDAASHGRGAVGAALLCALAPAPRFSASTRLGNSHDRVWASSSPAPALRLIEFMDHQ